MSVTLHPQERGDTRRSTLRELRSEGKVPGVVYGKQVGSLLIAIDEKELLQLLRHTPNAVIDMDLPEREGVLPVMVHEIQKDPIKGSLLHIDFHQINMNEPVRSAVTLEFTGEPESVKQGAMVQAVRHQLEIQCLPNELPAALAVDVSGLDIGNSLTAGDIPLPEGVQLRTDPNEVVVSVLAPQKEPEELEAAGTGEEETDTASAEAENEPVHA